MKVYIIAAISVDGFIAKSNNELINWTSPEDKKFFREMTQKSKIMVMGGNTFRTFDKPLPNRRTIVYSRGGIKATDNVEVTSLSPKDLIDKLKSEGATELAICGGSDIYGMFLEAKVVTDLYLTIEPIVFGQGISLFGRDHDVKLNLVESRQLNENTLLVHYGVIN